MGVFERDNGFRLDVRGFVLSVSPIARVASLARGSSSPEQSLKELAEAAA
jgi:hypothetical protein